MIKPLAATALLLGLFAASAQAQSVYRCGESYSNQPCPGATVVPTDDPRSAAQRAEADAATRRDARSAQVLEKDRMRQEAQPAQAIIPTPASQPPATVADKTVSKAGLKKPELFTAVVPRKAGDPAPRKAKKAAKKKNGEKAFPR